jgi:S-DNA-T family DNA segregation ATPase FtsK/SpoIIIE
LGRKNNNKKEPSNPPPHRILREIRGLFFLLMAVIFGGSLLSYHPKDGLFWNVTGALGKAHNLLGTVGAHLAGAAFLTLGFSSFWLIPLFVALALFAFKDRHVSSVLKTVMAISLLLLCFSGLLQLHMGHKVPFREGRILAGGMAGLFLADHAKGFLNSFGAYVLFLMGFIISLMVLTRISLGQVLSGVWWSVLAVYRRFREALLKRKERKRRASKTLTARLHSRPKPKVTVLTPPAQPPKKPEQELFSFMRNDGQFTLPALDLLNDPPQQKDADVHRESLEMNAKRLEKKLADFGVEGEVVEILPGPVITMYEYKPAPGIKISKVAGLSDDLALAFRAPSIRIVAPIPGKAAIGIEIPNNQRELVYLKEILSSAVYLDTTDRLPMALGKDITGTPVVTDLARMPHLLVAGATGSGKSVLINTIINSLLFKVSPDMVRFLLIDPKRIELSIYQDIPHLLHPVVTQPKEATRALRWAVNEMERRYMLLSDRGVRNIETYNKKVLKEQRPPATDSNRPEAPGILPYIILVIDELADLMMTSSRDVEESITRLAQMARAAGIHLIIATQRPSVDVLTGIIKANFPARISFQVSSRVDSRTILDAIGAEQLLGQGDMLFMPPGVGRITRIHGAYVSEEEIKRVTDFLKTQKKPEYDPTVMDQVARDEEQEGGDLERDEKYEEAINVVIQTGQASISMLQRKLRVGYNRAARMIELMEMEGIVGPSDGVRPREVRGRR